MVSQSWVGGLVKGAHSPVVPKGTGAHPLEVGIRGEEGVVRQPTAPDLRCPTYVAAVWKRTRSRLASGRDSSTSACCPVACESVSTKRLAVTG